MPVLHSKLMGSRPEAYIAFCGMSMHIRGMLIRMLSKAPCVVTYGGFSYRVEPVVNEVENTSFVSARLLDAAGELSQPLDEQNLTQSFPTREGAEKAWNVSFHTKKDFFIQRALVERMIDEGEALELEDVNAPAPRPVAALVQRSLWMRQ